MDVTDQPLWPNGSSTKYKLPLPEPPSAPPHPLTRMFKGIPTHPPIPPLPRVSPLTSEGSNLTLHALQKTFVNIFFVFAWKFCIEKWRGFLVNFFWSPFPTKRSTKNPRKNRGEFGAKFGAKSGTKIRKIRGTFVLQLF